MIDYHLEKNIRSIISLHINKKQKKNHYYNI